MQKMRICVFLSIALSLLIIPTAFQVNAAWWSASTTSIVQFSSSELGTTKDFTDNGQIDGYKTWSAYATGGWFHWGEVRVYVTSSTITTDNWSGLYTVQFKTHFDGKITVATQNQNVWLKITYQLKQGANTIFTTVVTYNTAQEWTGITITKTVSSQLSASTQYHSYVYYRYYCGHCAWGTNKVDFWQHSTQYHQWRGLTLSHT